MRGKRDHERAFIETLARNDLAGAEMLFRKASEAKDPRAGLLARWKPITSALIRNATESHDAEDSSMRRRWRNVAVVIGLGLYFAGLGFAGGVAADRIWFSRSRAELLRQYEHEVRKLHGDLLDLERLASTARESATNDLIGGER